MILKYATLLALLQPLAFSVCAQNAAINSRPTLDGVDDIIVKSNGNTRFVALTGITPGDEQQQLTQVSVSNDNEALIDQLEVDQTSNGRAYIRYRLHPGASGSVNVSVRVNDNGYPAAEIGRSFNITVLPLQAYTSHPKIPPTAVAAPPQKITLKAYPNPFVSNATITFSTPSDERQADLDVYSMSGEKIARLFQGSTIAGKSYSVPLGNAGLQPGVYIIKLTSSRQTEYVKLIFAQ
jgi:hypothetical protein